MPSWCQPDKGQNGALIGEIFFGQQSTALSAEDKKEIDKLADILATFNGELHEFEKPNVLLLGDTDALDSPTPKPELGKNRAVAVRDYLLSKLPPQAVGAVRIEPAGKGGAALPGMKPPADAIRRRVVEIINRGKKLTPMAAPLRKAASLAEALQVAQQALRQNPPAEKNAADRIKYWIEGKGKASIERGDDHYLHGMNATVRQKTQAGGPELSASDMEQLKNANRIGRELMAVAAPGNPLDVVTQTLVNIDSGIVQAIEAIFLAKGKETSGFGGSRGLEQLASFITQRLNDPSSFYAAYGGAIPLQREVENPLGTWRVTADNQWAWIYKFAAGGQVTWRDTVNGQEGSGKWVIESTAGKRQMTITWDKYQNKETWSPLPLNPEGQDGGGTWKGGVPYKLRATREHRFDKY